MIITRNKYQLLSGALLLFAPYALIICSSIMHPIDVTLASNDGPLGALVSQQVNPYEQVSDGGYGWADLNLIGLAYETSVGPSLSFRMASYIPLLLPLAHLLICMFIILTPEKQRQVYCIALSFWIPFIIGSLFYMKECLFSAVIVGLSNGVLFIAILGMVMFEDNNFCPSTITD